LTATKLAKKDAEVQATTLKMVMGKECKQILLCLELTEAKKKDMAAILDKLQFYFAPIRNILYEQYLFHTTELQPNKAVNQYMIQLRHLAGPCNFGSLQLRDHLVLGCQDKGAQTRLFRERDCNLKKALEMLQISEGTQEQLKEISGEDKPSFVNVIYTKKERVKSTSKQAQHTEEQKKADVQVLWWKARSNQNEMPSLWQDMPMVQESQSFSYSMSKMEVQWQAAEPNSSYKRS